MKRSNRFLIALVAAAATFGSLYAFTGRSSGFSHRGHHYDREDCGAWSHKKSGTSAEQSTHNEVPAYPAPPENQ